MMCRVGSRSADYSGNLARSHPLHHHTSLAAAAVRDVASCVEGTFCPEDSLTTREQENAMADERSGTVHTLSGKVEDGVGNAVDTGKAEVANLKDQAADTMKDAYGKTVDAAVEGAG